MFDLLFINWNVSPELFALGPIKIRYYGLFFAIAFLIGYNIIERMFKREELPETWVEKLFIYVIIGTIVGARLGHVFFYDWSYYSQHPGEILKIWHGGLASHGGAIGILIAIWLFSKRVTKRSPLFTLDRLVVPVALAAFFIRMGNLMNSEIYGHVTSLPWGFVFLQNGETEPKHPTQIYEALSYLCLFVLLMYMYWKTDARKKIGLLFGTFLTVTFTARFFIEFVKESQEAFEDDMILNMGQLLSIPFIIAGIYFIIRARMKKV